MATKGDVAAVAAAQLETIKPPEGIIIPPPGEIREIIEKTAGYVVRGGIGIEERLRENHGTNPKFSFVTSKSDAYNAYYEWRKAEYKAGRGTAVAAGRVGEAVTAPKPVKEEPKGPPKPPDFQFSARMPRMNQKDLEIVRLTALFVTRNGRQFQTQLAQRESKNPQFQFLIPNHTFHNFFQHMVDQYSILLKESGMSGDGSKVQEARLKELQHNVDDKFHVLSRAKARAEYAAWQEQEKLKQEEAEVKQKEDWARIDWNDFVVVETITFTDSDRTTNLPPPTTLNDIQYASLEEKKQVSISSNLRIEEAFPFDDNYYNAYPAPAPAAATAPSQELPVHPAPSSSQKQQQAPVSTAASQVQSVTPVQQDEEELQRIKEREEAHARVQQAQAEAKGAVAPMKIKENYVPRAAARPAKTGQTALCPRCNQQIPLGEWDEHMRIELLDPRWKEQKAKAESRYATTNISTVDVANNLKRLASQRTDVFDTVTGQPLSEDEMARRKKAAINSYDGNPDGKSQAHITHLQHANVEEQIRAIKQKFGADKKE